MPRSNERKKAPRRNPIDRVTAAKRLRAAIRQYLSGEETMGVTGQAERAALKAGVSPGQVEKIWQAEKAKQRATNPARKAKAGSWVSVAGRKRVRVVRRGGKTYLEAK